MKDSLFLVRTIVVRRHRTVLCSCFIIDGSYISNGVRSPMAAKAPTVRTKYFAMLYIALTHQHKVYQLKMSLMVTLDSSYSPTSTTQGAACSSGLTVFSVLRKLLTGGVLRKLLTGGVQASYPPASTKSDRSTSCTDA